MADSQQQQPHFLPMLVGLSAFGGIALLIQGQISVGFSLILLAGGLYGLCEKVLGLKSNIDAIGSSLEERFLASEKQVASLQSRIELFEAQLTAMKAERASFHSVPLTAQDHDNQHLLFRPGIGVTVGAVSAVCLVVIGFNLLVVRWFKGELSSVSALVGNYQTRIDESRAAVDLALQRGERAIQQAFTISRSLQVEVELLRRYGPTGGFKVEDRTQPRYLNYCPLPARVTTNTSQNSDPRTLDRPSASASPVVAFESPRRLEDSSRAQASNNMFALESF